MLAKNVTSGETSKSAIGKLLLYAGISILSILIIYQFWEIFRDYQLANNVVIVKGVVTKKAAAPQFKAADDRWSDAPNMKFHVTVDMELSYSYVYNGSGYSNTISAHNYDIRAFVKGDSVNVACSSLLPSISELSDLKIGD